MGDRVSFWGNENVGNLVMVAYSNEYTKNHWLVHLNWRILWYVNYIPIKNSYLYRGKKLSSTDCAGDFWDHSHCACDNFLPSLRTNRHNVSDRGVGRVLWL